VSVRSQWDKKYDAPPKQTHVRTKFSDPTAISYTCVHVKSTSSGLEQVSEAFNRKLRGRTL